MKKSATVLIVATLDTKGHEAAYLKACLDRWEIPTLVMDGGILGEPVVPADIQREAVAAAGGNDLAAVRGMGHEGKALAAMAAGAVAIAGSLVAERRIGGVLSLGGSMGTTLGTAVMRTLPLGFPKVMITTMASRDTRAFVGTSDIMMLHAVCDLVGLNRITRRVLHNGAMAMAGMMRQPIASPPVEKPLVFLTTLGTTEACAQAVRRRVEAGGREAVIFHTVGSGGRAMEEMIGREPVTAVVDLSLHEMADHRFGGDYDAGPSRGATALEKGIPTVLVPGNIDFLVTGPLAVAERHFPGRPLHQHNTAITVVRSTAEEMAQLAAVIAAHVNAAEGPWRILVPMGGFSAFDSQAGPMPDAAARQRFLDTLAGALQNTAGLREMPCHVNEPVFADAVFDALEQVAFLG